MRDSTLQNIEQYKKRINKIMTNKIEINKLHNKLISTKKNVIKNTKLITRLTIIKLNK